MAWAISVVVPDRVVKDAADKEWGFRLSLLPLPLPLSPIYSVFGDDEQHQEEIDNVTHDLVGDQVRAESILRGDKLMTSPPDGYFPVELDVDTVDMDELQQALLYFVEEEKVAQRAATNEFYFSFELSKKLAQMLGISEDQHSVQVTNTKLWTLQPVNYRILTTTQDVNLNNVVPKSVFLNCELVGK